MYCLDGAGKVGSGEWFEARDEEDALAAVRAKKLSVRCEVWDLADASGPWLPFALPDDENGSEVAICVSNSFERGPDSLQRDLRLGPGPNARSSSAHAITRT